MPISPDPQSASPPVSSMPQESNVETWLAKIIKTLFSALQCRLECQSGYVAQRTPLITCVNGEYAQGCYYLQKDTNTSTNINDSFSQYGTWQLHKIFQTFETIPSRFAKGSHRLKKRYLFSPFFQSIFSDSDRNPSGLSADISMTFCNNVAHPQNIELVVYELAKSCWER